MNTINVNDFEYFDERVIDKDNVDVSYYDGYDIITVHWFRDTDDNFILSVAQIYKVSSLLGKILSPRL